MNEGSESRGMTPQEISELDSLMDNAFRAACSHKQRALLQVRLSTTLLGLLAEYGAIAEATCAQIHESNSTECSSNRENANCVVFSWGANNLMLNQNNVGQESWLSETTLSPLHSSFSLTIEIERNEQVVVGR